MDNGLNIVTNFKNGHQAIVNAVDDLQLVTRSYLDAKPKIRALEELLLAHFTKQKNVFTDELRMRLGDNRQAQKMLDFLSQDLTDLKIEFVEFFERHSGQMADTNDRTFPADFTIFTNRVIVRLKIEEEQLFPLIQAAFP